MKEKTVLSLSILLVLFTAICTFLIISSSTPVLAGVSNSSSPSTNTSENSTHVHNVNVLGYVIFDNFPQSNVTVILYKGNVPYLNCTTNAMGYYQFNNVTSGNLYRMTLQYGGWDIYSSPYFKYGNDQFEDVQTFQFIGMSKSPLYVPEDGYYVTVSPGSATPTKRPVPTPYVVTDKFTNVTIDYQGIMITGSVTPIPAKVTPVPSNPTATVSPIDQVTPTETAASGDNATAEETVNRGATAILFDIALVIVSVGAVSLLFVTMVMLKPKK